MKKSLNFSRVVKFRRLDGRKEISGKKQKEENHWEKIRRYRRR